MIHMEKTTEDFKTQMQEWLKSQEGAVATEAKLDEIKSKRQEILNYLENRGLSFILNPAVEKSDYMWDCYMSISELLMQFDLALQVFEEITNFEYICMRDQRLSRKLVEFDKKLGKI